MTKKTYEDSTGRLRCHKCNGWVAMNPGGRTRCQKCVGKKKRAVEVARAEDQRQLRLAKQEEEGRNIVAWRDAQVSWYKSEILSRKGADRIRFFESHPLANICAWD